MMTFELQWLDIDQILYKFAQLWISRLPKGKTGSIPITQLPRQRRSTHIV